MQKISYMGNGTTKNFAFDFPFYEKNNIVVVKNGIITTEYDIVGTSGGSDANVPYIGGTVVFNVAPIPTDSITITRKISLNRSVDYQPTAKIDPTLLNQDINRIIEILKDFDGKINYFEEKYAKIINTESIQIISTKIDVVTQQIINLGDISDIHNRISTLNTRTNGMTDYVVATQIPNNTNNYTWYRKYKSGWIEQGGTAYIPANEAGVASFVNVEFPVEMSNANYHIDFMRLGDPGSTYAYMTYAKNRTKTSVDLTSFSTVKTAGSQYVCWEIKGFVA